MSKERELLKELEWKIESYMESNYWPNIHLDLDNIREVLAQEPETKMTWYQKGYEQAKADMKRQSLSGEPTVSQEPVAWTSTNSLSLAKKFGTGDLWIDFDKDYEYQQLEFDSVSTQIPLYTIPPTRQPLSDEEIQNIANSTDILYVATGVGDYGSNDEAIVPFVRAVEKAHNIEE